MKRITPSLSNIYPPVKLYLDDLEEIEDIARGSENLYFELGEYEFANTAEIVERYPDQQFNRLRIRASEPHLAIIVGKYNSVECYSFRDHTKASGIFYRLDSSFAKFIRTPQFIHTEGYLQIWRRLVNVASALTLIWIFLFLVIRLFYQKKCKPIWHHLYILNGFGR